MSIQTLKERINSYKEAYSQKIMRRVPIVITIDGRSFSRVTSSLDKPFSVEFSNIMCATAIKLCHEIEGAVFAYSFNDEINIICRNDQSLETMPWFQNDIQKICSASASIATFEFSRASEAMNLELIGDPLFTSTVFALPSFTEAVNFLISKQQLSGQSSLSFAVKYEINKKLTEKIDNVLEGASSEDKQDLLLTECGIAYSDYPSSFRRGFACYRAPILVETKSGNEFRNKWIVNTDLPLFSKDPNFLANIFITGSDIVRAPK